MTAPAADGPRSVPAGFGWDGGTGTTWRSDPDRDLTGILITQRAMTSPQPPEHVRRLLARRVQEREVVESSRWGVCAGWPHTPHCDDPFSGGSEGIECDVDASSEGHTTAPFLPGRGPSGGRSKAGFCRDSFGRRSYCPRSRRESRDDHVNTILIAADSPKSAQSIFRISLIERRSSRSVRIRWSGRLRPRKHGPARAGVASLRSCATWRTASSGGMPILDARLTSSRAPTPQPAEQDHRYDRNDAYIDLLGEVRGRRDDQRLGG